MFRSLSIRVFLALVLGLAAGAWIQSAGGPQVRQGAEVVEAVGGLWLNALRMTVVPLIFALLVTGIAAVADVAKAGGVLRWSIFLFIGLIFAAALYAVCASLGLLSVWPVGREAATAFIAGAGTQEQAEIAAPTFAQWLQGLAPSNPIRAAADDAILPLAVFAVFFGFGATRLDPALREPLVQFFRAVAEAMIVVVHWILLVGPIGVFALSLGVGLRAGFDAAPVLLQYIAFVSLITIGITLVAFILAIVWGRVPIGWFATAFAPVLAIAFSTQSSIASLPAMLEASRTELKIPARITDLVLPLAVAVFRFTSPVANLAVAFFIAHLYGLSPSALQITAAIFVAFAVSVSSVGLPGQVSFFVSMAPICTALGLPLDLLGILLAVEVAPDIFRTIGNVAGDMAATAIVHRHERREPAATRANA
jgi:Na+/H+-dicarboxylate symporter